MPEASGSIDQAEIARFDAQATAWWDPAGAFRPLHRLNPVRLAYLHAHLTGHFGRDAKSLTPLAGLELVDIGSGGGLVAEPMARLGAAVTGLDAGTENIAIATHHAAEAGLAIEYRAVTAESLAAEGRQFDIVLALEIIEHVADRDIFLAAAADLVRPGGCLVAATLNRTLKAFALAIVGAEYVLRWLPRGTHDWRRFLRPSELAAGLRRHGLAVADVTGIAYDPLSDGWRLTRDVGVNYMVFAKKPR